MKDDRKVILAITRDEQTTLGSLLLKERDFVKEQIQKIHRLRETDPDTMPEEKAQKLLEHHENRLKEVKMLYDKLWNAEYAE